MSTHDHNRHETLLRWFPSSWRARYGDEFLALLEDTSKGDRIAFSTQLSVARAGLGERLRGAALLGNTGTAERRARRACLVVLCAWVAFVVAGANFAKVAEGYGQVVPHGARPLAIGSYAVVYAAALVGAIVVACGACALLPAFLRYLRAGGWASVRRPVLRALAATATAALCLGGLIALAHSLTPAERNGQLFANSARWYYVVAFEATGLVVTLALALLAAAAVAVVDKLEISSTILRFEAVLSYVLAGAMCAITVATALWWTTIATRARWFLNGGRVGTDGSWLDPRLAVGLFLMLVGTCAAGYAVKRISSSWGRLA